ncbi:MAG: hypothetical protein JSR72_01785 [Proteobacteria bacterium]|nr:hypothetical protein [Pseudomonadota bacterium]
MDREIDRQHHPARRGNIVRIALFLGTIAALIVLGAAGIRGIDFTENRALSTFPTGRLMAGDQVGFTTGMDAWISDSFALRPLFIAGWNWLRVSLGHSTNPDVLIGSDGWLYSGNSSDLADIMGTQPANLASVASWRRAIVERKNWVEHQGSRFLFVVAPVKETVHPEHLPAQWLRMKRGNSTKAGQLVEALAPDGVEVLDLRKPMIDAAAESSERLYFKKDTHWNTKGALLATFAVLDRVRQLVPSTPHHEEFVVTPTKPQLRYVGIPRGEGHLDLGILLGLPFLRESDFRIEPTGGWKAKFALSYRDGYFLNTFERDDAPNLPTLLFYGDSYQLAMMRPLAEHFRRAVFINAYESKADYCAFFPTEFIKEMKPDIVVSLRLERGFQVPTGNPHELFGPGDCQR